MGDFNVLWACVINFLKTQQLLLEILNAEVLSEHGCFFNLGNKASC